MHLSLINTNKITITKNIQVLYRKGKSLFVSVVVSGCFVDFLLFLSEFWYVKFIKTRVLMKEHGPTERPIETKLETCCVIPCFDFSSFVLMGLS